MNAEIHSTPLPIAPNSEGPNEPLSFLVVVCCVAVSLVGLYLGLSRMLRDGAMRQRTPVANSVPTDNQADSKVGPDGTAQADAWERQRQEACERARAARVAYAILRNRGNFENSAACECQVRRAELADCEAQQLGQNLGSVAAYRHLRDRPIALRTAPELNPTGDPASNVEAIPDRLWHGGNDLFMGYHPQPGADAR